jgi:hypothetical protein
MELSTRESSRSARHAARSFRAVPLAACLLVAAAWGAALGPAAATTAADTTTPSHSCGWVARISGDQLNVAFPDAAAKYWFAEVPMPPGGHVELAGRFPHARYISFIDYTAATQAIDGIADVNIAPNRGSTNPFLAGADRTAKARSYSVSVVTGSVPSQRAANTLYTSNADGSKSSPPGTALLIYRLYESDRGLDITGGVGLPAITLVDSTGQRSTLPDCPDDSLPDLGLRQELAQAGQSGSSSLPNTGLGSRNPPPWVRYTGAANGVATGALDNDLTGNTLYPPASGATNMAPSGGFFENVNNAYMTSYYSAGFGAVVAYRGRAPLTPATLDGEPTMGSGQLRYWSFCTNNALTMYYDCVNDDAVAVDANSVYTVAISTAANRPANATTACGVTWLPAGPTPQSIVILRNMLPAPDFPNAIQRAKQGTERQTLGPYYPSGTYYQQVSDFERLGCHPPARIGPPHVQATASRSAGTVGRAGATCARASSIAVALRRRHGRLPIAATIYVGRQRVRLAHVTRAHARVTLPGSARSAATVKVTVVERFARGRALRFSRSYSACALGAARR